mmetsp:Transcript_202/g.743  ORF Transcript_202/g.743 Transcript_202/m.743 type:complete len:84 (+) Transcript_202:374-625(+)
MISIVDMSSPDAKAPADYAPQPACVVAFAEPAPHQLEPFRLAWTPVPDRAYRIWVRVGGGGGHELHLGQSRLWILEYVQDCAD